MCVGINDYPGYHNDLRGCVNDANDWAKLLKGDYEFQVKKLLDKKATKTEILNGLKDLVAKTDDGDVAVFTFSGHGTYVLDQDSDEKDNRDEALCAYRGNILDDDIRKILKKTKEGAHICVIADCCHSGTITREILKRTFEQSGENYEKKARFMPPKDAAAHNKLPIRKRMLYPESDMNEVLLTGCNSTEYSYDAFLGGRFNGAMTATAIKLIKAKPNQTYRQLHKSLRKLLPSANFPQSPQLEASKKNKDRKLFS